MITTVCTLYLQYTYQHTYAYVHWHGEPTRQSKFRQKFEKNLQKLTIYIDLIEEVAKNVVGCYFGDTYIQSPIPKTYTRMLNFLYFT